MGVETVLIEGVPYSPLAISHFALAEDMRDNMGTIRHFALRANDPLDWELRRDIRADLTVEMLGGDNIFLYEARVIPDDVRALFDGLKNTKLPKYFGRRRKLDELRGKVEELLASAPVTALVAEARQALVDKRDMLEKHWMDQLKSIPVVRVEVAEGTPLVVMPPLKDLAARDL